MLTTEFFNDIIDKAKDSGYTFAAEQLEEIRDSVADKGLEQQRKILQRRINKQAKAMDATEKFSVAYQLHWSKKTIADNMLYYLNFHYGEKDEK